MESVIVVCHLIVAIALIAVILVQTSEAGGFLGSGGSMSNMLAPRRSEDVLTRLTKVLAGLFFATSLILAVMASHHPKQESILDVETDGKSASEQQAPVANDNTTTTPVAAPVTESKPAAEAPKEQPKKSGQPKAPIAK